MKTIELLRNCHKIAKMSSSRVCYLLDKLTNRKIFLPHEQLKVIGRSVETEIKDLYVSKSQLEILANTKECKVRVKPIGRAICGIDGYATMKDKTYTIGHGHIIEIRLGYHQYEIVFDPPPDSTDNEEPVHVPKKQKLEFPIFLNKTSSETIKNATSTEGSWESIDNKELLIYSSKDIEGHDKIAAFDVDGTIITTKSGARFPKDAYDWKLLYPDIPSKLKDLQGNGYKIVFFTNQSGVGKDSVKIQDFKMKIENILEKIAIPAQVFIATGKTMYRKPCLGMWTTLCDSKNNNVSINLQLSFYVGDAAGRDKGMGRKNKDHSCADRLFALNIGLKFYTPEEYFLKASPQAYKMPEFDPRTMSNSVLLYPDVDFATPNVILMVGGPGSGKSHFCKSVLVPKGYVHINRDTLGSWQKCVKKLEECLESKRNCVIDNTNLDIESRARFIRVAKTQFNVECRCFTMNTTLQHNKHNNKFRELTDKSHVPVSEIIINSLQKSFQPPTMSEGFDDIISIPFIPKFNNKDHEKLYKMFLLEK